MSNLNLLEIPEATSNGIRDAAKAKKPPAFSLDGGQLPFERMSPEHFELLIADLYRERMGDVGWDWYDKSFRLNGGADMGQDVVLFKNGEPVGVIQCKRLRTSTLTRRQMLYELCKFFLFARIFTDLAPAKGKSFKYIFAVAKDVHKDGITFFQSSGKTRFTSLRAQIEEIFGALVKDLKTFSSYPGFNNLSPKEICDLVWDSLLNVETSVYRQNELSDFVRNTQSVCNNYFALQHVAIVGEELERVIAGYFRAAGAPSTASGVQSSEDSFTIEIPLFATHNDKVNIVLIQGAGDFAIESLKNALEENGSVNSSIGGKLTVILAGSSAFEFDSRERIEEVISSFQHPLVVIGGCGEISGEQLNDVKCAPNTIWYYKDFFPATGRKYKFGWCWLKLASTQEALPEAEQPDLRCYPLIVNTPVDPILDSAEMGLRLSFDDLVLYPVLDDDLISSWSARRSILKRLALGIQEDLSKRKSLVCGAVHWSDIVDQHDDALNDLLSIRRNLQKEVGLILANSSLPSKFDNAWRSISGVFPSNTDSNYLFTRRSAPKGLVLRRDDETYIVLILKWVPEGLVPVFEVPYFQLNGRIVKDINCTELELSRHMRWHSPHFHANKQLQDSFAQLYDDLSNSRYTKAGHLSAGFFNGIHPGPDFSPDDIYKSCLVLCEPLHAACYLSGASGANWVQLSEYPTHIDYSKTGQDTVSLFMWTDRGMSLNQVETIISEHSKTGGAAPDLIVFTSVLGDPEPEGRIPRAKARDNIASPSSLPGSITEPSITRKIYMFSLREIQNAYMKNTNNKDTREEYITDVLARKEALDV